MRSKTAGIILLTAALTLGGATAASADDYAPTGPEGGADLAGSTATGVCQGGAPYILYDVVLNDPFDEVQKPATVTLVLHGAGQDLPIELGVLGADNRLSGRLLWPGASVGANGKADGWPGWEYVGGSWRQTDGNFAWTRTVTEATLQVNPEFDVALSYPAATPNCTDPDVPLVPAGGTSADPLAHTGVSAMTLPIGIGAGVAVLLGLALAFVRRRRTSNR